LIWSLTDNLSTSILPSALYSALGNLALISACSSALNCSTCCAGDCCFLKSFTVVVVPSTDAVLPTVVSPVTVTQIQEQNKAKSFVVPAQQSYPITKTYSSGTLEQFGCKYLSSLEATEFTGDMSGGVHTPPFNTWFWHIVMTTLDLATTSVNFNVEIYHDVELFNKNVFLSSVPT